MRKWGSKQLHQSIPVHIHSTYQPETTNLHQGLGSSSSSTSFDSTSKYLERQEQETDYNSWHSFTTGTSASTSSDKASVRRSAPIFVKATSLSLTPDQIKDRSSKLESERIRKLEESLDSIVNDRKGKGKARDQDDQEVEKIGKGEESSLTTSDKQLTRKETLREENGSSSLDASDSNEARIEPRRSGFSSFYESFKKELSSRPQPAPSETSSPNPSIQTQPSTSREDLKRKREYEKRKTSSSKRSEEDWFISKAQEAMRVQREKNRLESSLSETHTSSEDDDSHKEISALETSRNIDDPSQTTSKEGRCSICSGKLPIPLTSESQADHNRSLGHRLALDSSKPLPIQLPSSHSSIRPTSQIDTNQKFKSKGNDLKKFRLKDDNKGYGLLSKMGWKEGMGLGREEEERTEEVVDTVEHLTTSGEDKVKSGLSSQEAIMVDEKSDVEGQEESREDLATWEDIASSEPEPNPISKQPSSSTKPKPKPIPKSNRTLDPISIKLKNNRLGLGASSRNLKPTLLTRDEEDDNVIRSRNFTPIRKSELKRQRKNGERLEGGTMEDKKVKEGKRQRKEREEREKREWRLLRESLG